MCTTGLRHSLKLMCAPYIAEMCASERYEIRRFERKLRRLRQFLDVAISFLFVSPAGPPSYRVAVIDLRDGRCVFETVEDTNGGTEELLRTDLATMRVAEFEKAWGLQ